MSFQAPTTLTFYMIMFAPGFLDLRFCQACHAPPVHRRMGRMWDSAPMRRRRLIWNVPQGLGDADHRHFHHGGYQLSVHWKQSRSLFLHLITVLHSLLKHCCGCYDFTWSLIWRMFSLKKGMSWIWKLGFAPFCVCNIYLVIHETLVQSRCSDPVLWCSDVWFLSSMLVPFGM